MPRSFFDHDPANYDRARPQYPAELFDELIDYIGPRVGGIDAIEVGPGTGQATAALLARGMRVIAVELGQNLAAFLGRKFAHEPRLKVVRGAFEEVPLDSGSADLVIAATAWHWTDPATRFERAHTTLLPNGVLAVLDTVQVRDPVDRDFFERTYPIYLRYRPNEAHDVGRDAETYEPPAYAEMRSTRTSRTCGSGAPSLEPAVRCQLVRGVAPILFRHRPHGARGAGGADPRPNRGGEGGAGRDGDAATGDHPVGGPPRVAASAVVLTGFKARVVDLMA